MLDMFFQTILDRGIADYEKDGCLGPECLVRLAPAICLELEGKYCLWCF